jgi:GTP-binding protein Era
VVAALQAAGGLGDFAEVVPISALTGEQLDVLAELVFRYLPEGEPLFPEDQVSDEPERHFVAEVIREKAISLLREELPHSVAVVVEEMGPPEDVPTGHRTVPARDAAEQPAPARRRRKPKGRSRDGARAAPVEPAGSTDPAGPGGRAEPSDLLVIRANLFVERSSQKPIVLGRGGAVLRDIGTRARAELEQLLGTHVFLDLHVKVAKEWQRDPKQLARLGY